MATQRHEPIAGRADRGDEAPMAWLWVIPIGMILAIGGSIFTVTRSGFLW